MATYYVTKVQKESAGEGSRRHRHIIAVMTEDGVLHRNQNVVVGITLNQEWKTKVTGAPTAEIQPAGSCSLCDYKPYLKTDADNTAKNNLENLPEVNAEDIRNKK